MWPKVTQEWDFECCIEESAPSIVPVTGDIVTIEESIGLLIDSGVVVEQVKAYLETLSTEEFRQILTELQKLSEETKVINNRYRKVILR